MIKKFGINEDNVYKIAVVATMSSGKSTFINSLIGREILSSQNEACTSRILPILDNDKAEHFRAFIEYRDKKNEVIELEDDMVVSSFNDDEVIKDILIEGNIEGIKNNNKAILLVDTPGTNFSGDVSHKEATYNFLNSIDNGLIIYLINATQIGIKDDMDLLVDLKNKIDNKKMNILFAINKIDQIDLEKEDITHIIKSVKDYIEEIGFNNPTIVPISSLAAKLFKIVLNGGKLTRKEIRTFKEHYDLFASRDFDLRDYVIDNSNKDEIIKVGKDSYARRNLLSAIENTGITYIEDKIEEYLYDASNVFNPEIKFNDKLKARNRRKKKKAEDK